MWCNMQRKWNKLSEHKNKMCDKEKSWSQIFYNIIAIGAIEFLKRKKKNAIKLVHAHNEIWIDITYEMSVPMYLL